MAKETKEQVAGDQSYFDGMEGQGLDAFTADTLSTAYLAMVQPDSSAHTAGHDPGTWRNSASDENFGNSVKVIPVAFKTVWTERSSQPPFSTVGQYDPNSIDVTIERPKPGQRGFPKMTNPTTGNKVEELFVYALMLKDHPESGILYFSPTVSSMKACKMWNTAIRSSRLPNGKLAPLFAYSWDLYLDLVQNPARPNTQIAKFVKAVRGEIVSRELFTEQLQPQLASAAQLMMIAAPEKSGDAEE